MVLNGLPLVSGGSFVLTVILFVAALAGGCSRSGSVTEDPASIATATNETSSQATIEAAEEATLVAMPSTLTPIASETPAVAATSTPTPTATPTPTPTPIPAPTFLDPNELKQVWNGYLVSSEYWAQHNPRYQDFLRGFFRDAYFSYRLTMAGRFDTFSFRDFLGANEVYFGGFVNYKSYLRNEIDRMIQQDEWIGPNESLNDYAERMDFTRRSVDLTGFLSDNLEVEIVIRIYYGMSFDALERFSTPVFDSDGLSNDIDRLLGQNILLLLAQEFARRDFDWWGS